MTFGVHLVHESGKYRWHAGKKSESGFETEMLAVRDLLPHLLDYRPDLAAGLTGKEYVGIRDFIRREGRGG